MGNDDAGFTLTEVLVALTISVLLIATGYRGLALGARGLRSSELEMNLVDVARAELSKVGGEYPLLEGVRSGRTGLARWSISITPYRLPSAEDRAVPLPRAFWAEIEASADTGRSFRMTTLKLAGPSDGP